MKKPAPRNDREATVQKPEPAPAAPDLADLDAEGDARVRGGAKLATYQADFASL